MQSPLSSIWTRVVDFIFCDDNGYATNASLNSGDVGGQLVLSPVIVT